MDGNRRWAKKNSVSLLESYNKGADNLAQIAIVASNTNAKTLNVFAFSLENMKRSDVEKKIINTVLNDCLDNKFGFLLENDIKLRIIGNRSFFDKSTLKKIENIEKITAECNKMTLNICFYYSGKWDILNAISSLKDKNNISENDIVNALALPELDLCIRVSGEQRVSNFALWQLSYAEIFFSSTLWPDFSSTELLSILNKYQNTNRRFGQ